MIAVLAVTDGTDSKDNTYIRGFLTKESNGLRQIISTLIHGEFLLLEQYSWSFLTIIHNLARLFQAINVVSAQCQENCLIVFC